MVFQATKIAFQAFISSIRDEVQGERCVIFTNVFGSWKLPIVEGLFEDRFRFHKPAELIKFQTQEPPKVLVWLDNGTLEGWNESEFVQFVKGEYPAYLNGCGRAIITPRNLIDLCTGFKEMDKETGKCVFQQIVEVQPRHYSGLFDKDDLASFLRDQMKTKAWIVSPEQVHMVRGIVDGWLTDISDTTYSPPAVGNAFIIQERTSTPMLTKDQFENFIDPSKSITIGSTLVPAGSSRIYSPFQGHHATFMHMGIAEDEEKKFLLHMTITYIN